MSIRPARRDESSRCSSVAAEMIGAVARRLNRIGWCGGAVDRRQGAVDEWAIVRET
jgi:hypothetical protein